MPLTDWRGSLQAATVVLLAAIPWLIGLIVGLLVTVTLLVVAALIDGYKTGRWEP
jgi:hypothetical protein